MAYEPTEWVCGDTVTADKLNKLERGIQEIMSDYVPTNWQCGDVITAEKLNKLEQAVANAGGGSWQTVFEGSVTTVAEDESFTGEIVGLNSLTANTIKVTFNGTEYTCEKDENGNYGAPFNFETEQHDWSEFPFAISNLDSDGIWLITQTAGTYTLEIEEEQSGSSDFSTAEVLITNNTANDVLCLIPIVTNEGVNALGTLYSNDSGNMTIPLYTGTAILFIDSPVSITGDIADEDGLLYVTGNGTITIS